MEFAIVLVGGLIGGYLVPSRPKLVVGAFLVALLYVGVVFMYALVNSYQLKETLAFLLLMKSPDVTHPGLAGLVIAGDIWVLSTLVAAARVFFASRSAHTAP